MMFNDHLDRLEKLRRFGQPEPRRWNRALIAALVAAAALLLFYCLQAIGL